MPDTLRTDPGVRHYRTGLLPRVMTRRHPQGPAVRGRAPVTGQTRLCVRPLVCWTTFPLARSLPSTSSAGPSGQPLFEGFLGTMKRSDSLHPCITVVPRGFTVRTWQACQARGRASRVPHTVFPCLPEVSDPAGSVDTSSNRYPRCGLLRRSGPFPPACPVRLHSDDVWVGS